MTKLQQTILGILGIGVALAMGGSQTEKGGLLYDGISAPKVAEKFANAPVEIKGKYQMQNTALKIEAADKNSIAVKIGDETKSEFEPVLTLNKWDKTTELRIKPKGLEKIATKDKDLAFEGDKIKFSTPDIEYHFYDAPTSTEEGGYEYEIVLNKYTTNTFYSTIDSTGLAFYKQLPLDQEEHREGETCTDTECQKDGVITSQRPENVVNSYAVYYTGSSGDYTALGGYNYKAGKAYHIYRVKAVDADGQWIWCDQNIVGNEHQITCDDNWLKSAKYPVKIDPTFGYTSAGDTFSFVIGADDGLVSYYQLIDNANVSKISFYAKLYTGSSVNCKGIIYNNNSGEPGTKNSYCDNAGIINSSTASWKDTSFNSNVNINSGYYWIGIICQSNGIYPGWDSSSQQQRRSYIQSYSSPLNTWDGGGFLPETNTKTSIYATYEAASTYSRNSTQQINNARIQINNGRIKQ